MPTTKIADFSLPATGGGTFTPWPCEARRNFCFVSEYSCRVIGSVVAVKPKRCAHCR